MAKGLRSKSKVASRNAKRYDPKTDYAIVQAARLQQTASRLASKNKSSKTVTDEDAEELEGQGVATTATAEDDKMMDEETTPQQDKNAQKVSTSGTRESRRETWRKAKGWKPKIGSKNGGRPKRRR